jgi:hypothetical protein
MQLVVHPNDIVCFVVSLLVVPISPRLSRNVPPHVRALLFYDVKSMENPTKKATKRLSISGNSQNSQVSIHDKDKTLARQRSFGPRPF